jgi:hypothetical protein
MSRRTIMRKTRLPGWAFALATAALLGACGGGGGDDSPAPLTEVPDTALASPAAYTEFARSLAPLDAAEPLSLGRLEVAPTSETDEPASLD